MAGKGILLSKTGTLLIKNKSVVVGDSELQEVAIILQMNQGEDKFNPIIGANLIQEKKTNKSRLSIERRVKTHLALDNKDFDLIKEKITINLPS